MVEPSFPSFETAYIAQQLKAQGHTIELLDIDANRFSTTIDRKFA